MAALQHTCGRSDFAGFDVKELEQSLVARFARQVSAHPSCLAVRDRSASLSYADLDGWANGIAQAMLARIGEGPDPVPLVFAQGAASTAAILGTLKAGRAYVSLDPSDPRSARAVEAVGAVVVLTDAEHADSASRIADDVPVIVVDEIGAGADPCIPMTPDSLAYVFFTSGSTGEPKGVVDNHRNVLHNVLRYSNTLHIAPSDRLSLIQSPSFSGCISSLFAAVLNGAALFPFRLDEGGVPALARWLREEQITMYHSVPSIFRALLRGQQAAFPDIRVVRLEGDRASGLDVELHRRHFEPGSVLVNGLGLTETGLVRQLFLDQETLVDDGILPVGYPVPDVDVVIVDEHAEELPLGASGQIAVRSAFLAQGYWNRSDLTERAFVDVGGERTYLTGDLGRLREDGCLEYLGRLDGQLKVLGNRVEPAEVEAELVRLAGVKEAAVTTREGRRDEGRLVAYVVLDGTDMPSANDIRRALGRRLPKYMVPSAVVTLDELPLSQNGKVDRRALPDVSDHTGDRLPADDIERLVARVWEDVLEAGPIGVDGDFFVLGGDSLAAAEIMARLEHETGNFLPMSVLAGSPTVAGLADALRTGSSPVPSSLAVLRSNGDRAPLVLVHGNTGNALHYVNLVRRLDRDRPIWALEYLSSNDLSVEGIAAAHAATLLSARATGPYLLAGSCFGGVVAHELACQLRARDYEVELLALLGLTPLEFPSLMTPQAHDRWDRMHRPMRWFVSHTRYHVGRAWTLPARERVDYLATRAANLLARATRLRRTDATSHSVYDAIQVALAAHRPARYPGAAVVVLHQDDTAIYTENPLRDWAKLADTIELVILPGRDHAMLEEPGVARLADIVRERLASVP